MNHYITGAAIRTLRERRGLTQSQLAELLCVSDKTISKWETARGLPDVSLLEPLAAALHVSVPELLSGQIVTNTNHAANMLRSQLYVCPICGNILHTLGPVAVSCCGVTLPPLEPEKPDDPHAARIETFEDELFVHIPHEMAKTHFISFVAYCTADRFELIRLYPESNAETYFFRRGHGRLYWHCNRHGLFRQNI